MKYPVRLLFVFLIPLQLSAQNRLLDQPMQFKSCQLTVKANGFYAESVFDISVFNPRESEAEQVLYFGLQPGQVITGLDLDLNGQFREGSIEEKWKANNTYNSIVGKRVDPAIVQMLSPNRYRLNVYPVPAGGTRRLRLHIAQLLPWQDGKLHYRMFIPFQNIRDGLQVSIQVRDDQMHAVMGEGLFSGIPFRRENGLQVLQASTSADLARSSVEFFLHTEMAMKLVCSGAAQAGQPVWMRYFFPSSFTNTLDMTKFSVFWDVSGSMKERQLSLELQFLKKLIALYQPEEVLFVLFANKPISSVLYRKGHTDLEEILEYLRTYKASGATCLGNLTLKRNDNGPVFLFTDGINSFGKSAPVTGANVVHSISSSTNTDTLFLKQVSFQTGGRLCRLNRQNIGDMVEQCGMGSLIIQSRGQFSNPAGSHGALFEAGQIVALSGGMAATLKLNLLNPGINNLLNEHKPVMMNCDSQDAQRIGMLMLYDSVNLYSGWNYVLGFGLKERVVTQRTSFIVLERVEDYIQYQIEPPKELEEACRLKNYVYNRAEKEIRIRKAGMEEKVTQLLAEASLYSGWWNKMAGVKDEKPSIDIPVSSNRGSGTGNAIAVRQGSSQLTNLSSIQSEAKELTSVVVTSLGMQRSPRELGYSITRIKAEEINRVNPVYLANGLTGRVSGLQIQTVNSGVFENSRITLRGIRSLTGNNQPLLVVDNLPLDISMISVLNPNDISSVTILKSASGTAIYGPDGVNGAIVVQTKRGSMNRYTPYEHYRLADRDNEAYIDIMNETDEHDWFSGFQELEDEYGRYPIFYFDMAEWFFQKGKRQEAFQLLMQAAEMAPGLTGKISMAYILESWKEFDLAIDTYKQILEKNPNQLQVSRDLALAYYQQGNIRAAAETYLHIILSEDEYGLNLSYRLTALQEFNAMLVLDPCLVNSLAFDHRLILVQPLDMKVELSGPSPYGHLKMTSAGSDEPVIEGSSLRRSYHYQRRNVNPYYFFKAAPGQYRVYCTDYFFDNSSQQVIPDIERLVIFRNFQRPNQTLEIRNINLTYQHGSVELDGINW